MLSSDHDADPVMKTERIYIGGIDAFKLKAIDIFSRLQRDEALQKSFHLKSCNDGTGPERKYLHIMATRKVAEEGDSEQSALGYISKKYNNVTWKGCRLVVEAAQPHFLDRLKIEQAERKKRTEQNMSNENQKDIVDQKNQRVIPRRLRVRRRHGDEAVLVDTHPRLIEGREVHRLGHLRRKQDEKIKKALPEKKIPYRALHVRFNRDDTDGHPDSVDERLSQRDTQPVVSQANFAESESESEDGENSTSEVSEKDATRQREVDLKSVSSRRRLSAYQWSSSSESEDQSVSEDERSKNLDDSVSSPNEKVPKGVNTIQGKANTVVVPEHPFNWSSEEKNEDSSSSVEAEESEGNLQDGYSSEEPRVEETSGEAKVIDQDLQKDVASNFNILSSMFPTDEFCAPRKTTSEEKEKPMLSGWDATGSTMLRFDPSSTSLQTESSVQNQQNRPIKSGGVSESKMQPSIGVDSSTSGNDSSDEKLITSGGDKVIHESHFSDKSVTTEDDSESESPKEKEEEVASKSSSELEKNVSKNDPDVAYEWSSDENKRGSKVKPKTTKNSDQSPGYVASRISEFDFNPEDASVAIEFGTSGDDADHQLEARINIQQDVEKNLDILSSMFPSEPISKPATTNPDKDGVEESKAKANTRWNVGGVLMQRYDPNDASTQKFIVEKDEAVINDDNTSISLNKDTYRISGERIDEAKNSEDERKQDDQSSEGGSGEEGQMDQTSDAGSETGDEHHADRSAIKAESAGHDTSSSMIYEQDKLESVFRDAREGWDGKVTAKTSEEYGEVKDAAFSFSFNIGSSEPFSSGKGANLPESSPKDKGQVGGSAFAFSFDLGEAAPLAKESNRFDPKKEDSSDSSSTCPTLDDSKLTPTTQQQEPSQESRRGKKRRFFTKDDLMVHVSAFFDMNDGARIREDLEGYRNDPEVKQSWMKERDALTQDWKRKRKQAISYQQKQKNQHR